MKTLKLELTIDDTNTILESLGQMPFVKVFELITKIQQQAGQQLGEGQMQMTNGLKTEKEKTK